MYRSPYKSPCGGMSRTNSSRSIGMPGGPINGQKSPMTQDRFTMYKSPNRVNSFHENCMNDFDCHSMGMLNVPGTPGTPKSFKALQVTKKAVLDAPDVKRDLPAKLIDMNERNEIVIALENNVYIWKENNTHVLLQGKVPIDGVCWVGDHVAISGLGHVELWDVRHQETIHEFQDHKNSAAALSSYGNNSFATGGDDGIVYMYDLRTSRNNRMYNAHNGQVCSLSWSPDGSMLASGGDDNNVCVFEPKRKIKIGHNAPVNALAWMKPGLLVTGQSNRLGEIGWYNLKNGEHKKEATGSSISGICMSEKWGLLVSHDCGTWDIWSHDLSRKADEYRDHTDSILNITSNADCSFVATISADESLILWEISQSVLTPIQGKSPRSMRSPAYAKSPSSCMPRSPNGYSFRF